MNKFARGQVVARNSADGRENEYGVVMSTSRILDPQTAKEREHATVMWFGNVLSDTVVDTEVAVVASTMQDFVEQSREQWQQAGAEEEARLHEEWKREFGRAAMSFARDSDLEQSVKDLLEKHGIPANQRVKAYVTLQVEIDADYVGDFVQPLKYTDKEFMFQSLKHLEGTEANVFLDDDWENQHLKVVGINVDSVERAATGE